MIYPKTFELEPYKGKESGVIAFAIGKDYIICKFKGPTKDKEKKEIYLYNYKITGKEHVENMKDKARAQKDLNSYINSNRHENNLDYAAYWDYKKNKFISAKTHK